jgi:hypothetical protein
VPYLKSLWFIRLNSESVENVTGRGQSVYAP